MNSAKLFDIRSLSFYSRAMARTRSEGSFMPTLSWTLVLALASLVAATTASADTVITAEKVMSCSVGSAGADSVRLTLTRKQHRTLPAWDIYEVRLSDPNRMAELAALLPRAKVTLDSGQSVAPPEVRILEAMRLRLDRARAARAQGISWPTDAVETLALRASPAEIAMRCLEMDAVLRHCGRSDDTLVGLTSEVDREAEGLRGFHLGIATCLAAPGGMLLGTIGGTFIGGALAPQQEGGSFDEQLGNACGGCASALVGSAVGLAVGPLVGLGVRQELRERSIASHHARVNDLVRRVNLAVASSP